MTNSQEISLAKVAMLVKMPPNSVIKKRPLM
ncbi:Uncharacterised protein [Vibrio cholerae]|nr:Uncharacterised protein [Vibrio cholerae]